MSVGWFLLLDVVGKLVGELSVLVLGDKHSGGRGDSSLLFVRQIDLVAAQSLLYLGR